ncbi:DUF4296 domain-containing protein [Chryseobacterium suipulveris]|uniref:DUF4296 domain-containing protein n=1 Tax=Chryseobacterium suipulveris TaxID=2929800 RepID=A0ABY4BRE9_9FLAO|nr:DUF4296 domain-containing protein [Chryseobacterium suipulveris]UOE41339.1 DUF4296 domain-containing protein [Chryseobacterium suipulveris]
MRKLALILFSLLMVSCSQLIDEPKNLVPKNTMSELIAEFAMNDQVTTVISTANIEDATRITLKQKNIKATDFVESYKYYLATGDLEKILNNAQEIVLEKDPAAKKYIEKKLKETEGRPAFAR